MTINTTLVNLLNNSSTDCIPPGYNKMYPQESVASEGFIPTTYYKFLASFANSEKTFEYFRTLVLAIVNQPYNPLVASSILLGALTNILGLSFITEAFTENQLRQLLYAKLLANVNNGTIRGTTTVYNTLMASNYVRRVRIGVGTVNVSYSATGGPGLIISLDELNNFWSAAHTGGIDISLSYSPGVFFGFLDDIDPDALGFSSIISGVSTGGGAFTSLLLI